MPLISTGSLTWRHTGLTSNTSTRNFMEKPTTIDATDHAENIENLREYAQALIAATAHVKDESLVEWRNDLIAAVEKRTMTWETLQARSGSDVNVTDSLDSPDRAALDIGALVGYLLNHRDQMGTS